MHKRYDQLDALRGLAAASVFVGHMLENRVAERGLILKLVSDGAAAVDLFFVLSGFVLSLSLLRRIDYFSYAIRRAFRLYPAYWFSIAAGIILVAHPIPGRLIAEHIAMLTWRPFDTDAINPVIWTIVIEMKISLLLPLIVLITTRWGSVTTFDLSGVIALLGSRYQPLDFLRFLPLFAIGLVLAQHLNGVRLWLVERHWGTMLGLVMFAMVLYFIRDLIPSHGSGWKHFAAAAGSAGFIAFAVSLRPFESLLNFAPLMLLGRISFSLYLFHYLILRALPFSGVVVSVCCVVAASIGIFTAIERPSQVLGRQIASLLCQPTAVSIDNEISSEKV